MFDEKEIVKGQSIVMRETEIDPDQNKQYPCQDTKPFFKKSKTIKQPADILCSINDDNRKSNDRECCSNTIDPGKDER